MATVTDAPLKQPSSKPSPRFRLTWPWILIIIAAGLALVSLVRLITDANDITSVGQVSAALRLAVPIGLAGLGGLWSERAGVVNIGLEGMMILGTWFGAWAGYQWGPWTGVLFGVIGGILGGLLHALATVTFGVNHIVSGVAINILALGATKYLSKFTFQEEGGSAKQSPPIERIDTITVPGLSDWMKDLNGKHWFFISDVAGFLGGVVTGISLLTVLAILIIPATWFVLWRTPFGLRLRSCGENPHAAESLGVNVYKYKYIAVIVSGGLAGLGGYFLADAAGLYQEGQTGNRGYIGLATMIFGNWMPGGTALGALLFGYTDSLNVRSGGENVHALLLLLVILMALAVVWQLYKSKAIPATVTAVIAGMLLWWYLATEEVPSQFVAMAPYVTTIVVLALFSKRLRMPKADGLPYRKGEG
ncbi:ABC transporter permease [Streptomyces sp. NPDC051940]|uniref:ABC transporter permease n=1 Tax=Streptomyces sp. NPDC051940 TaxID=3155675 RepID=UPI00342150F3